MSEKVYDDPVAGYNAHKAFLISLVWKDLSSEVSVWLEEIRDTLETLDDSAEYYRLQGCAKACRYFLGLPQSIIDQYEIVRDFNN